MGLEQQVQEEGECKGFQRSLAKRSFLGRFMGKGSELQ
jgi:hypothetical protein